MSRNVTMLTAGALLWWTASSIPDAVAQQTHELKAGPTNVHIGHFNAAIKPALSVKSGDIVVIDG
jgi:hypothetical protein